MSLRRCVCVALLVSQAASATPDPAQQARERAQFLSAFAQARRGLDWPPAAAGLEAYPLWSYLEAAGLRHLPERHPLAATQAFLAAHGDEPQGKRVREESLLAWANAARWSDFLAIYVADGASGKLQCHAWTARWQATPQELDALREAARLWRATPRVESACAPAFTALEASGQLADEHRLLRIHAAFEAGDLKLAGWLIAKLTAPAQVLPARELALRHDGFKALAAAQKWPADAAHGALVAAALARLAARDPQSTEVWRLKLAAHFKFEPAQSLTVLRAIALAAAIDDLDEARGWLQRIVPGDYGDPRLYEWATRYWLGRGKLAEALPVLAAMPDAQKVEQPRWRYVEGRVLELQGDAVAAQAAYARIANDTGFYPFLAADRLDRPYAICPQDYIEDPGLQAELLAMPAVRRLRELYAVDLREAAGVELKALAMQLDAPRRVQLAGLLFADGRYAEVITLLGSSPEFQRYYTLRFPRPWGKTVARNAAAQQLDVNWTTGLIRAESAFNRHARSGADARGLMQMLPGTARHLERSKTTPDLYAPAVNLRLGTRYLKLQLERFGGDPIATTAAYNAGPGAVQRWIPKVSHQWRDLWIETMPYYETRDYVGRVLAFSVIYDWRDDGQLTRLGARLALLPGTPVKAECPAPP